jgi:zinc finger SWIM domain-containing protein 3
LQLDIKEHITNIFWVDAKMLFDYAQFGDVVTFDTTLAQAKNTDHLVYFLGSISLERLLFLVLQSSLMKQRIHFYGSLRLF